MKKETTNSFLEYIDNIVFVRLKEGARISIESMMDQYKAQKEMVGNDTYVMLVDTSNNTIVDPEARPYIANHNPPNCKAIAIVTKMNAASRAMANLYVKMDRPKLLTKRFANEEGALDWLKNILEKATKN